VRSDDLCVRSSDSGLDSREVHRPRGWIIGPGRGVDKGDEFVMQLGGVLLRLDFVRGSPCRDPSQSPRGPSFSAYVTPPARGDQRLFFSPQGVRTFLLRPLRLHSDPHLGVPSSDPRSVRSLPARFDLSAVS